MATVLVIDDHAASRDYLTFVLEHTGHRVITAEDGSRGLELARSDRPALIISDILMPTMDGIELARHLRADPALANIPLIFYTATYRQREAERVAATVGASRVLLKPADPDVLLAMVAELIGSGAHAPAAAPEQRASEREQLLERLARATSALDLTSQRLALLIEAGREFTAQHDPRLLAEQLARAARSMVSARYAVVLLAQDRGGSLLRAVAGLPHDPDAHLPERLPDEGLISRVFASGPTLRESDLEGPEAAGLPRGHPGLTHLIAARVGPAERPVGLVYAVDKIGGGPFEATEEVLLSTLADQVGTVHENSRLYRDLQQELADRKLTERRLAIQYGVTRIVAEPIPPEQAVPRVLAALGSHLDWAFGAYWSRDAGASKIRCRASWSSPKRDVKAFEQMVKSIELEAGEGLVGEVWNSARPFATAEVSGHPGIARPEELVKAGIHAVCAFPVISSVGVEAVVELFSLETVALDEATLDMMGALGALVGQYLERKRAMAALEESEERHRVISELTTDFTYSYRVQPDGTMQLMHLSSGFAKMFELQPRTVEGDQWLRHIHPDDQARVSTEMQRLLAGHESSSEFRVTAADGKVHYLRAYSKPVLDGEGRVVRFFGAAQDLTNQRMLEEQLRQSQKMEAVGRLAGGIAHDFNNMLTVINGYAGMVLERVKDQEGIREDVAEIATAGERAASLTRQLLAFSRRQVLQPRVMEVNTAVAEMDRMLQRLIGENIELVTRLDPRAGLVKIDPTQVEQVLMNLVVNARDAMPSGGKLTIETSPVDLDRDYAQTHPDVKPGPYVLLAISDTGIGMDREVQARIFEPFFTTKKKGEGTGLGLSTVYGIVQQSGGHVRVYSEPGHGTTLRIYLPREGGAVEPRASGTESTQAARAHETVLIVEDEPSVRKLSVKVLRDCGYTVLEAEDAPAALEIAGKFDGHLHLIVTDVVMPSMSGPELLERVREKRPALRALFVSGYTEGAVMRHGTLKPGTPFLAKPFSPASLARRVREVLEE